jgi:hypothetical protein
LISVKNLEICMTLVILVVVNQGSTTRGTQSCIMRPETTFVNYV